MGFSGRGEGVLFLAKGAVLVLGGLVSLGRCGRRAYLKRFFVLVPDLLYLIELVLEFEGEIFFALYCVSRVQSAFDKHSSLLCFWIRWNIFGFFGFFLGFWHL